MIDDKKMTRRSALKYMGASVAGVALASMGGLSCLTSCTENGKKRIVFYFTATGNSLYAARQFSETPLSIPQVMKENELVFEADEIGLVFPDYRAMAPEIVKRFLQKATLKAPYLFSIITYGHWDCNIVESWNKFALQHGVHFNYITTILMVDNWLPVFDMNEEMKIDKQEKEQFSRAVTDVLEEKNHIPELSEEERKRCEEVLNRIPVLFPVNSEDIFEVKGNCIGCGVCTRVCPRKNYILSGNGVKHSGDCEYCLACIQNCPQKAIVLKSGEANPNARYRHPHISLNDIVRSNIQ